MKKSKKGVVKVAGMWEQGWNTPFLEHDLWEYPLRDFEVDEFYMMPISGIDKPVTEVKEMKEVIEANPDLTVVWVDETAEVPLSDFVHPKNALYILGRTTSRPMVGLKKDGDLTVRVETKPDHSCSGLLWAHQAIAIVLYDRLKKSWL
jgi:hypothetical protein